ncbi:HMG-Y-related protein B-like [Mangifera indica]|uniref:HMG-Y-related protein B-like n=1 Tax=Mangifera indica TaxID=29780 RepID=UPI001CFA5CCE|nr:HMG-Y-related protein B-like [Mangifera indica]
MASTEDSINPLPSQQQPIIQPPPQQQPSSLAQYPEMIMAAIEALNEKTGSSKAAISKQMELAYSDLSAAHSTLLSHHLNKLKESGQLVMVKNNYMKPDPNAPPKRGRGRPPKPKTPLPPGTVISPPRPRGRPPKPRDPFAPPAPPKKKSSTGSGRPRGRPPKKAKTTPAATPSAAPNTTGAPRGRGRPPKVKPAVAPVAG